MLGTLSPDEAAQLNQTIEMFEVITQSQPQDYQSLEILKEAYLKLGRQKDVVNTSKRIAQAYVQLGQLSSAILEYETILQRFPEDKDVLAAMAEIESKANSLTAMPATSDSEGKSETILKRKGSGSGVDDGRSAMQQLFVDSKVISMGDFEMCWINPNFTESPGKVIEPFLQMLADKAVLPIEKSLKMVLDKSRLGFLPIEKYDVDMELARTFPKDVCQRYCVVPFDKMSKSVLVATANPFNKQVAQELQTATPGRLLWYVAPPMDLVKVLRKVFR